LVTANKITGYSFTITDIPPYAIPDFRHFKEVQQLNNLFEKTTNFSLWE